MLNLVVGKVTEVTVGGGAFYTSCNFLVKDDGTATQKSSSFPLGDECREISYVNLFYYTGTSFSVGMNECQHVTRTAGILRAVRIFSRRKVCVCLCLYAFHARVMCRHVCQ
jgi:hypothetical protein